MRRRPVTDAPEDLAPEQWARIGQWVRRTFPRSKDKLRAEARVEWEKCRDWHLKNGVLAADWEAAFRWWVRKKVEMEGGVKAPEAKPEAREGAVSQVDFLKMVR